MKSLYAALMLTILGVSPGVAQTDSAKSAGYPIEVIATAGLPADDGNHYSITPDQRFAFASVGSPELWDVQKKRRVRIFGEIKSTTAVAISNDARLVAAADGDKTVIIWDAASGRVVRAISHQFLAGLMLFSPDGTRLVVGGQSQSLGRSNLPRRDFAIYDIRSGQLLSSRFDLGSSPWRMAAFPSEDRFAVAGFDGKVRVFDYNGKVVAHPGDLLKEPGDIAVSASGRYIAACDSVGIITVWDGGANGAARKLADGSRTRCYHVSWSPDETELLSFNLQEVKIWNPQTGELKRKGRLTQAKIGEPGYAYNIDFSRDGRSLLLPAMGFARASVDTFVIDNARRVANLPTQISRGADEVYLWKPHGLYRLNTLTGQISFVMDPGPCQMTWLSRGNADGSVLGAQIDYSSAIIDVNFKSCRLIRHGAALEAISSDGRLALINTRSALEIVDLKGGAAPKSFPAGLNATGAFAPDGASAIVDLGGERGFARLDVASGQVTKKIKEDQAIVRFRYMPDGQSFLVGDVATSPSGGVDQYGSSGQLMRKMRLPKVESIYNFEISADGKSAVVGGNDGRWRMFDIAAGAYTKTVDAHGSVVSSAFFAARDTRIVTATSFDGVKVWDSRTGQLLVTYYVDSDTDWLAITPEGYFDVAGSAAERVSLVSGRDVMSIDAVFQTMYRPDLVREKLSGDPKGNVKEAAAKLDLKAAIASGTAPKVRFTNLAEKSVTKDEQVAVDIDVTPQAGGIGKIEWRVNGVTSSVDEAPATGGTEPLKLSRKLALEEGDNRIEVVAFNAKNLIAAEPVRVDVKWEVTGARAQPRLFIMAVGVNDYWDSRIRLKFAAPDAEAIADAFSKAGKGVYQDIQVVKILDDKATKPELSKAFAELSKSVRPRDVFVFYLAGHGKTVDGSYYFIPQDFRYRGEESIVTDGIGNNQWQGWLAGIAAKKSVLIYDTCESGSLTADRPAARGLERVTALERMTRAMGRTVLSAATDDAPALEGYNGHGVFTYAILDALDRADSNNDGLIDVTELAAFVDTQVPEISERAFKMRQVPQMKLVGSNFSLLNKTAIVVPSSDAAAGPAIPTKPTHVVLLPADVKEAADAASAVQRIAPGTLVTVIETSAGWSIIAKEGRKLGVVESSQLAPLQ